MSQLTGQQRRTAATLKTQRPMCYPGTDQIIVPAEGKEWHDRIVAAITAERVPPELVTTFCEVAGVVIPPSMQALKGVLEELKAKQQREKQ